MRNREQAASVCIPRNQRGAALVIGLVLLLVLTILAVSGMNSVSVELIMAGNDQYRELAFQSAEAGIEQSINTGTFDGSTQSTVTGTVGSSSYSATIFPQYNGQAFTGVPGSTTDATAGIFYEVTSTATSTRGAQVTNWQGLMQLVPSAGGTVTGGSSLGLGSSF